MEINSALQSYGSDTKKLGRTDGRTDGQCDFNIHPKNISGALNNLDANPFKQYRDN